MTPVASTPRCSGQNSKSFINLERDFLRGVHSLFSILPPGDRAHDRLTPLIDVDVLYNHLLLSSALVSIQGLHLGNVSPQKFSRFCHIPIASVRV